MNMLRILFAAVFAVLAASSLMAQNVKKADDNSWLSLNGTVVATDKAGFEMDYGSGFIKVQMNNWQWYDPNHPIQVGDNIRVNGIVDNDQGEKPIIEASSIYIKDLNTYVFKKEAGDIFQPAIDQEGVFQLQGVIVDTDNRRFTMNLGSRKVIIDTTELPYNPLDDKGYQQLKVGDTVQVTGELKKDNTPFKTNVITANVVTTLLEDKGKVIGN
ncbi:OB-fold nucleic acid binding domain-containing protein [Desulfopila inferna]|uniref:OB-fold nucleic acid binding domain-containing protein n=1 Tax=Desulfopila inferna TaxID=468528 RepID=UPI0019667003|nr:DUF5666 domain-containing protein [Desulfopila inferna]MBM9603784.1 hypothetical protein [Desulfopila inferna]